jgi:hypothetical protein
VRDKIKRWLCPDKWLILNAKCKGQSAKLWSRIYHNEKLKRFTAKTAYTKQQQSNLKLLFLGGVSLNHK